jgi:hypothetical protein
MHAQVAVQWSGAAPFLDWLQGGKMLLAVVLAGSLFFSLRWGAEPIIGAMMAFMLWLALVVMI